MANKLQIVAIGDGKEHRFADPYQVDKENRLYLNGVYIAWYSQTDETSMTYEAFCDLVEGLKMALPGLAVEERHITGKELPESWTNDDIRKSLSLSGVSSGGEPDSEESEEKKYLVDVVRIAYSRKTVPVWASSRKKAAGVAIEMAGDHEFSTYSVEYVVEGVSEAQF